MENRMFRTSFYGFRRKDVMDYLEMAMQERKQSADFCQKELDTRQKEWESMIEDLTCRLERETQTRQEAESRVETLRAERARAVEQCETQNGELDVLRERVATLKKELEESQLALEEEREKTEILATQMASYTAVKDRLSNIELSAHQRAAEVERAAELEAENIQRKARDNVLSLQMQYELAMSALDAGRRQVTEQLCEMQTALDALGPALEQSGQTLVNLCEERCKAPREMKEQEVAV